MGKIIFHAFPRFIFQNCYFYQIESIWIIRALLFNLDKIVPVVGLDEGTKSVGFSGLLGCLFRPLCCRLSLFREASCCRQWFCIQL